MTLPKTSQKSIPNDMHIHAKTSNKKETRNEKQCYPSPRYREGGVRTEVCCENGGGGVDRSEITVEVVVRMEDAKEGPREGKESKVVVYTKSKSKN